MFLYISGVNGYNHWDHSPVLCSLFITCSHTRPDHISSPTLKETVLGLPSLVMWGLWLMIDSLASKKAPGMAVDTCTRQVEKLNYLDLPLEHILIAGLSQAISGQLPYVRGQQQDKPGPAGSKSTRVQSISPIRLSLPYRAAKVRFRGEKSELQEIQEKNKGWPHLFTVFHTHNNMPTRPLATKALNLKKMILDWLVYHRVLKKPLAWGSNQN